MCSCPFHIVCRHQAEANTTVVGGTADATNRRRKKRPRRSAAEDAETITLDHSEDEHMPQQQQQQRRRLDLGVDCGVGQLQVKQEATVPGSGTQPPVGSAGLQPNAQQFPATAFAHAQAASAPAAVPRRVQGAAVAVPGGACALAGVHGQFVAPAAEACAQVRA